MKQLQLQLRRANFVVGIWDNYHWEFLRVWRCQVFGRTWCGGVSSCRWAKTTTAVVHVEERQLITLLIQWHDFKQSSIVRCESLYLSRIFENLDLSLQVWNCGASVSGLHKSLGSIEKRIIEAKSQACSKEGHFSSISDEVIMISEAGMFSGSHTCTHRSKSQFAHQRQLVYALLA